MLTRRRIVYVGAALSGKLESLLSVVQRAHQALPSPPSGILSGEHRYVLRRKQGGAVELAVSISGRRAWRGYDPTSATCDPIVLEEIDRIAAADGLIFVIDSDSNRKDATGEEYARLGRDMALRGVDVRTKPIVFQANKRDLPDVLSMDWVREHFRAERCAYVESVATQQVGTLEAMREVLRLTGAFES